MPEIVIQNRYDPSRTLVVRTGDRIRADERCRRENSQVGSVVGRIEIPPGVTDWSIEGGVGCHELVLGGPGGIDQVMPAYGGFLDVVSAWPRDNDACVRFYCAERISGHIVTIGGKRGIAGSYNQGATDCWWDQKWGQLTIDQAYHSGIAFDFDVRVSRGWYAHVVYHGASTDRGQPFNSMGWGRIQGDVRTFHLASLYTEVTNTADGGACLTIATNGGGTPYRVKIDGWQNENSRILPSTPLPFCDVDASFCSSTKVACVVTEASQKVKYKGLVTVLPSNMGQKLA